MPGSCPAISISAIPAKGWSLDMSFDIILPTKGAVTIISPIAIPIPPRIGMVGKMKIKLKRLVSIPTIVGIIFSSDFAPVSSVCRF